MGMSATQARYLSLVAQQSNLEYQGQQINQERAILSQQVSDLYNSLLAMTVPTPPSTQDYTTVEYAGKIGATAYAFDASTIKPGNNGGYIVTVNQDSYGDSLQKNASIAKVENSTGKMTVVSVPNTVDADGTRGTGTYSGVSEDGATVWMVPHVLVEGEDSSKFFTADEDGKFVPCDANAAVGTTVYEKKTGAKPATEGAVPVAENKESYTKGDPRPVSVAELENLYVVDETSGGLRPATVKDLKEASNGGYVLDTTKTYYQRSSKGEEMPVHGAVPDLSINGKALFELSTADITDEQRAGYEAAIANSGLTKPDGTPYQASDFYVYFDDNGSANFVLKSDITDGNDNATTYAYTANGSYSKPTTYNDCKLVFDPSSGRITEISFPNYATTTDADGNKVYDYSKIESYTTMAVKANTVTDEMGYQEAFAKYEYAQYEYDKAQQEINAKTEIIQQQDRNLELKLQRLDTQRTQITTEIEALEKVLNDNIEASYKTFSG